MLLFCLGQRGGGGIQIGGQLLIGRIQGLLFGSRFTECLIIEVSGIFCA